MHPPERKHQRARNVSWLRAIALWIGLVAACAAAAPAIAIDPNERLADPALEQRARDLSANLRCLVCQNQSIDDSDAPLAKDLRRLVRDRLKSGDSDDEVQQYIVDRYGTFVLLTPPFELKTLFLWLAPWFLLLAVTAFVWLGVRRTAAPSRGATPLTDDERDHLESLLKNTSRTESDRQ
ncbi:MAG: cytochrome c-type biogenesis protein [Pseudomonadota bacterium]